MNKIIFLNFISISALVAFQFGCAKGESSPEIEPATQATCESYLATDPNPAGIPAVSGGGIPQRADLLAAGGKLVAISNRYYAVYIPNGFYSATNKKLIFNLHGTGGYPEAEWNDWNAFMASQNFAFIALAWGGGTPAAITDTQIYSDMKQILSEVALKCPISEAKNWLFGFSVGSAFSFAVAVLDRAGSNLLAGQLAVSGSAISPMSTGKTIMHSTVESNQSNSVAVSGIKSWLYCDNNDLDHTWNMCTEMPYGRDFINNHGGTATLFSATSTGHHSLPSNSAGKSAMATFINSN